jgi:hypothetical protein
VAAQTHWPCSLQAAGKACQRKTLNRTRSTKCHVYWVLSRLPQTIVRQAARLETRPMVRLSASHFLPRIPDLVQPHCYCTFATRGRYTRRSVGITRTASVRKGVLSSIALSVTVYQA